MGFFNKINNSMTVNIYCLERERIAISTLFSYIHIQPTYLGTELDNINILFSPCDTLCY